MTIIALAVAQFVSTRRVAELEATNRELTAVNTKLRAEAGYLEVTDPNKVAALRLTDLDEYTWRWKVWLPPGNWWLSWLGQDIPLQGVPNGSSTGTVRGGREVFASATVRKGADGKWNFRAKLDSLENGSDLNESHQLVESLSPGQPRGMSPKIAGDNGQQTLDPAQPVVLIRLRVFEASQVNGQWQAKENPEPCDGIMVWIHK
jgi:hypothetical protein